MTELESDTVTDESEAVQFSTVQSQYTSSSHESRTTQHRPSTSALVSDEQHSN